MSTRARAEWRIHLGLICAEAICVPAFIFEFTRATGGNNLSWAYVFEWPLFGGYAIYMWRQLLRQERGQVRIPRRNQPDGHDTDAKLAQWNEYLTRVHDAEKGPTS